MAAPDATRTLDVYEIACLAGGQDRMIGRRARRPRAVRAGARRPPRAARHDGLARRHPVEAAVLDAVGPVGHRSIDTIRWRVAADERLLDVASRLHRAGLLGRHHPHLPGHRSDGPTIAGRRVLHRLSAEPPLDDVAPGTDAMQVALHGRGAGPSTTPVRRSS